ncbi:hypothetical protein GCM10012284_10540 [Mangrovihabitans endophyticus]|uniref:Glucose-methanol-choline oxidoreductase N-terminal domain-containing protein n=1 Tax=Mangrovihabitans endophyticus TaxID=1751298 RepID=A0A8J3BXE2_9ACTN|nr:hypothetical protein GCM10012284_10540 [Mangrovihabitans endophyticus]
MSRRRVYLPRGRVLGGSSSINTMVYVRGHRLDYDGWNQSGWRYADMLPYFKRSEDNERGASEYHGTLVFAHSQPISLITANQPANVELFRTEGRGPLTANGPEAGGFVRLGDAVAAPDVEFLAAPVMFVDSGLTPPTQHAFSFGPSMLTPHTRGSVSLASDEPTAKPYISHDYFADGRDLDAAVEATRAGLRIARQKALEPYTETPFELPASDSDADVRDFIRHYAHSIFHPAGTCAMGSVVDADLRVQGVDGLRVVDASIMPSLVRGNPNAPTIAIAEKAADLIAGTTAPEPEIVAAAG